MGSQSSICTSRRHAKIRTRFCLLLILLTSLVEVDEQNGHRGFAQILTLCRILSDYKLNYSTLKILIMLVPAVWVSNAFAGGCYGELLIAD